MSEREPGQPGSRCTVSEFLSAADAEWNGNHDVLVVAVSEGGPGLVVPQRALHQADCLLVFRINHLTLPVHQVGLEVHWAGIDVKGGKQLAGGTAVAAFQKVYRFPAAVRDLHRCLVWISRCIVLCDGEREITGPPWLATVKLMRTGITQCSVVFTQKGGALWRLPQQAVKGRPVSSISLFLFKKYFLYKQLQLTYIQSLVFWYHNNRPCHFLSLR